MPVRIVQGNTYFTCISDLNQSCSYLYNQSKGMRCCYQSPLVLKHDLNLKPLCSSPAHSILLHCWQINLWERCSRGCLLQILPKVLTQELFQLLEMMQMILFKLLHATSQFHHLVVWQSPSVSQLRTRTQLLKEYFKDTISHLSSDSFSPSHTSKPLQWNPAL